MSCTNAFSRKRCLGLNSSHHFFGSIFLAKLIFENIFERIFFRKIFLFKFSFVSLFMRMYLFLDVRGTALGLLAVPTKLGNPGGWEYRRVLLYSHRGVQNNRGNFFFSGKLFFEILLLNLLQLRCLPQNAFDLLGKGW